MPSVGGETVTGPSTDPEPPSGNQSLAAPTNVSAEKRTNTAAYVKWSNSNSGSLKYQVEYWEGAGAHNSITTYFTDLVVSNLNATGTYSFRVRALTDAEDAYSPWSETVTLTLATPAAPAEPTEPAEPAEPAA